MLILSLNSAQNDCFTLLNLANICFDNVPVFVSQRTASLHQSIYNGKILSGRDSVGVDPLSRHRCPAQLGKEAPDSPSVLAKGNSHLGVGPKRYRAKDCDANRSHFQHKQTRLQARGCLTNVAYEPRQDKIVLY